MAVTLKKMASARCRPIVYHAPLPAKVIVARDKQPTAWQTYVAEWVHKERGF